MRSPRQAWPLWLLVAWGVILFGAVYQWAYIPLLTAAAATGAYGWWSSPPRHREPARGVLVALLAVACVVAMQLIPLPAAWLARVSPATDTVARQFDLPYAAAQAATGTARHPMSIAPAATLKGLAFFLALSALLAGATAMMPRVRVKWLIRRIAALGLAMALFGIVQRGTFNGKLYWVWTPINTAGNAFGSFVNRNHFAGWMLMAAALTAGYVCSLMVEHGPRRQLSWRQRIASMSSSDANRLLFASCALAVMVLSIVWTLSRSGITAFAVATGLLSMLVSAPLSRPPANRHGDVPADRGGVRGLVERRRHGRTTGSAARARSSGASQLWRDTLAIVRDFPWFGTGLNTYGVSTLVYPMSDPSRHAVEAHSDYVQILSEGGIVLAAAAAFVVLQAARAIRRRVRGNRRPRRSYWVRTGATLGLIAIAIQELTDFSLQMPGNAVLFVLLAAIAMHRPPRHERPFDAAQGRPR